MIDRHDRHSRFWDEQAAEAEGPDTWKHPFLLEIRDIAAWYARKARSLQDATTPNWPAEREQLASQEARVQELQDRMWKAAQHWSKAAPPGTPPISFDLPPSY